VLAAGGREPEAIDEYRQALALEPGLAEALTPLRAILVRRGRFEDLRAAWGAALDRGRPEHDDYYGYAELCLYLGRQDDYRAARRTLLRVFAEKGYWVTAERTARACLLLPATDDELARAAVLADRAAALDRAKAKEYYPYFQFAGGLADYRRGRCEKAITTMRGEAAGVLGPAPQLVLAMALHQNGQSEEARRTLAAAVAGHDWRPEQVRDQNDWIFHILRREAEAMIQPNPAACPVRTTP
jgi:serine/threonine-protein kinase